MQSTLETVLAEYESAKHLQELVTDFWNAYTSIIAGPNEPTSYGGWRGKYRYAGSDMKTPHLWYQYHSADGTDVRLASIDLLDKTFEVWYPGEDSYEPDYHADTEGFPLEWLYTDEWREKLTDDLAEAYEVGVAAKIKRIQDGDRARYEELRRKFGE